MTSHSWITNKRETKLHLDIPKKPSYRLSQVFWQQGFFYFQNKKRVANVTDVAFIDEHTLIVAHREAARIYLFDVSTDDYQLLDCLILRVNFYKDRFFHPDLISVMGNKIYVSEYSNRCCVVQIKDRKLSIERVFTHGEIPFHGCYAGENQIMLGSVSGCQIPVFDHSLRHIKSLKVEGEDSKRRIKTIGKSGAYVVLGIDKQHGKSSSPNDGGESWFNLYREQGDNLILLDSIYFPDTQIDGHVNHGGYHFITMEDSQLDSGCIVVVKVVDEKLTLIDKIPCESFPHGLDICNGKLAYTSYANGSFILCDIKLP